MFNDPITRLEKELYKARDIARRINDRLRLYCPDLAAGFEERTPWLKETSEEATTGAD